MMMTSTWQKQDQERKTPTHFVAIPVSDTTDTGIHSRVQTVQKTVVSHDETLKPALIPVETLHLTLLAIHLNLENEEREIEKADKILQQCRTKILKDVLPSGAFTLKFKGLDFRFPKKKKPWLRCVKPFGEEGRFPKREKPWLRYVKPFGEEGIQKLEKVYDEVRKTFTEGGFPPTDPDREFYPHVTVINLNNDRDFFEKKGISKIPEESFSTCGALDLDFGEEQVSSLCLYEMGMKKAKDGRFRYNCVAKTDF